MKHMATFLCCIVFDDVTSKLVSMEMFHPLKQGALINTALTV